VERFVSDGGVAVHAGVQEGLVAMEECKFTLAVAMDGGGVGFKGMGCVVLPVEA